MRIAMMQMAMTEDMERNLQVSYEAVKEAAGADLLFFPEVQHMPFLPQYTADELPDYLLDHDDPRVTAFYDLARQAHCMVSPNLYLQYQGQAYDTSLFIDEKGNLLGKSASSSVLTAICRKASALALPWGPNWS